MNFLTTLTSVAVMLAYAVPGYIMIKVKAIKQESISAFSVLLMYVAQPCLTIYSFEKVKYSASSFKDMCICFVLIFVLQSLMLAVFYLIMRKKESDVKYRIYNLAICFGNCTFMGIPLVEALLPNYPDAVIISNMFFLAMSLLGWTVGSAIIARDTKYISVKKILLNPAVISLVVALPIYFFNISLPTQIVNMVTVVGKMTAPLVMLGMGMRLATLKMKTVFTTFSRYIIVFIKQIIMPLLMLALVSFLPISQNMKITLVILSACPVAGVIQSYSEMIGEGQNESANLVLLGTLLSLITIPLISLIF